MHEKEPEGGTHFRINGFIRRLVFTRRQQATNSVNPQFVTSVSSVSSATSLLNYFVNKP